MPESVVRDELDARTSVFRESRSCDLAVAIPTLPRTAFPPHTSLCQWRADPRCPRCGQSPNSAACESRWNRICPPRVRCNAGAANASATRSATADTHLDASLVGAPTSVVAALPRGTSLRAVAAGETTQRLIVAVLSGRKRRWRLLSRRPIAAGRSSPQPNLPLRKPSGRVLLPSRRALARVGTMTSKGGVSSTPRRSHPTSHTLIPLLKRSRRRPQSPQ